GVERRIERRITRQGQKQHRRRDKNQESDQLVEPPVPRRRENTRKNLHEVFSPFIERQPTAGDKNALRKVQSTPEQEPLCQNPGKKCGEKLSPLELSCLRWFCSFLPPSTTRV